MLTDVGLIYGRELRQRIRQPAWLVMSFATPLLYMFFFGPLLKKYVQYTPGFPPGGLWTIFAPALMLQMVIVGSSYVGVGLLTEYRSGVFHRFQVTPIRPVALLLGKVLADASNVVVQCGLIMMLCWAVFHLRLSILGTTAALVIAAVLSVVLSCCSCALALLLKSEQALPTVLNALLLPLLLLSGTLLPITSALAPSWLYDVSRLNPVAYVMDLDRNVFRGDFSLNANWLGVAILIAVTFLSMSWAMRTYNRQAT
jgi:ABC-2 type transport system permease protein